MLTFYLYIWIVFWAR